MSTQHDEIDVGHLVRIGLIGTILTIATSYYVAGLNYFEDQDLQADRLERWAKVEHAEEDSAEHAADLEAARAATLRRYSR
ncbi:MAG: hypothetical protein ACYSU1_07175 [Planctomycetota bacterium]|jgi:hypothetical protein